MEPNRIFKLAAVAAIAHFAAACAPAGPQQIASQPPSAGTVQSGTQTSGGTFRPPSLAGVRTRPVVPGRPGRVFVFAALDAACGSLPEPELVVTRLPAKGEVSFRPGQVTKIAASANGTCKDAQAAGTGVYYTAKAGTSGTDTFSVTAKLASGETMTRDFSVKIAE